MKNLIRNMFKNFTNLFILTSIFIILKIFNIITWDWVWVFSPIWLMLILKLIVVIFGITILSLLFTFVLDWKNSSIEITGDK